MGMGKAAYLGASHHPFLRNSYPNSSAIQIRNQAMSALVDTAQSYLLARRLVEAGIRVVTFNWGGWDTHGGNLIELKDNLLPKYDRAVVTPVSDPNDRGLPDKVLVLAIGEFGRTPRVNDRAGRDHWPQVVSVLLAGGGLKMGQAVGANNRLCERATDRHIHSKMHFVSLCHSLGIDSRRR